MVAGVDGEKWRASADSSEVSEVDEVGGELVGTGFVAYGIQPARRWYTTGRSSSGSPSSGKAAAVAHQRQKSSLLLPMAHYGERAREQGEGSNVVEVWGSRAGELRRAEATSEGDEQGQGLSLLLRYKEYI